MKASLLQKIDQPNELEALYRQNRTLFKKEFLAVLPEIKDKPATAFWQARLQHDTNELNWGNKNELLFTILLALMAGLVAKLPQIFTINEEYFYTRNVGFLIFPFLSFYFAWKNKLNLKQVLLLLSTSIFAVFYINSLPQKERGDTLILACIHLPIFLWSILGYSFIGGDIKSIPNRLAFLRFNGDLIVMTTLMLIAGMLLTGITIGLFSLIGFHIENFYMKYVVIFGLAGAPIIATFVVQTNPQLVNKVSPVIAKIFSPLVLVTLIIYLMAIFISGKDPYNDRDFLLTFNGLLIGVMALILFSVAETAGDQKSKIASSLLFLLSLVTVIVNSIALSAIIFRISEWGLSPNRLAVLGGNILMLIHLLLVCYRLMRVLLGRDENERVEKTIAQFLPVYSLWTIFVTFLVPLIFGFK